MRPTMSSELPAANGTIARMPRVGQACANVDCGNADAASAAAVSFNV